VKRKEEKMEKNHNNQIICRWIK